MSGNDRNTSSKATVTTAQEARTAEFGRRCITFTRQILIADHAIRSSGRLRGERLKLPTQAASAYLLLA
jgi:hypothetical protein